MAVKETGFYFDELFVSIYPVFSARVGRKTLRNGLNSIPDLIQDFSLENDSTKRHHERHHQRQPCEQQFNFKHVIAAY